MWTHRPWLIQSDVDKPYYSVYYQGFMPMSTWRQVAVHLDIDNVAQYMVYLKDNYPSVRFTILPRADRTTFVGLSIDFSDEDDAKRLAEYCNTVAKNKESA